MMKTKILLFAMACAFTVQASAQSGSVKYNDFVVTNPSNIKQGVLANGFRYYLCDNGVPGNKLEMRLIQKSGTDEEGDIPGIALLLRRMLCSENLTVGTAGVLKDKLDELNLQSLPDFRAVNGLVPNVAAYCSEIENRCTEYNLFRLNNERTYAASCMGLLAQVAGNARFSAAELERQKQLAINEITNSRYNLALSEANYFKAAFVDGCTLDELMNKQIASIRSITLQQLQSYYQRWYVPQNQCLYVFGKAPANIVDIIKQQFGSRPSMPAPEPTPNQLSNQLVLMIQQDVPACIIQFCFLKPRMAPSDTKNLNDLRKAAAYNRLGEVIGTAFNAHVVSAFDDNHKLFNRPVFTLTVVKGLEPNADQQQFGDFADEVIQNLNDVMCNGVQAHITQLPIEKRKQLQQQELARVRNYTVLDTHTCIKNNFVYGKPLLKETMPYQYFKHEVSDQDIRNCCQELFSNADLRVVCVTPNGYPDADIKAKLEAFLSGK